MDEYEHIEELIVKHLGKETTPAEQDELQKWLDTDPLHRQDYLALERIWQDSGSALHKQLFDKSAAWEKMQQNMNASSRSEKTAISMDVERLDTKLDTERSGVERLLGVKRIVAAASVLLALISAGWWFYSKSGQSGPSGLTVIRAEKADREVHLPDGSLAWLRRGATLQYTGSFDKKERRVEMNGEIFYDVAHNSGSPFTVKTAHALIEDIGTSFLVKARESSDEIAVATGKVRVTDKTRTSNSLILVAGEKTVLKDNLFVPSVKSDPNILSWKTGVLNFNATPLDHALEDIGDYYQVAVKVPDELKTEAEQIRITARFERQSLKEVLEEISLSTLARIRQERDTIFFRHP